MNKHHDEPDLDVLHRAVLRERQEPFEGTERVPVWMIAGFTVLVGWGGWYLGRYDARFDPTTADMQATSPSTAGATPAAVTPAGEVAPAAGPDGAQLYASRCAACHQPTGAGMAALAPPLAGSSWVTGDEARMLKIVLHGLTGPIEVAGETWNGAMPAWGASMTDAEIAAVTSHVRSAWGNDAPPIAPSDVAAVRSSTTRSTPWTVSEL